MAKYCTKCGSQCADQATYCPRCGAMLPQRAVEGGTVSHKKRNHTWIVGLVAGVSVLVIVLVSGLAMLMYSKWKDNSTNSDKNILTNQSADEGDPGVDDLNIPYFEGQTAISRGQEGDFEYEEYEDGICVIAYTGSDKRVEIPDTIQNKKVLQVGNNGESVVDTHKVDCVVLPSTVKSIGGAAFKNTSDVMTGLSEHPYAPYNDNFTVEGIVDGITYIGEEAFRGCNFNQFVWPSGTMVMNRWVFESANITTIIIPDTVVQMEEGVFKYSSLQEVSIPGSVSSVGDECFRDCLKLTKVELQDGIKNLCDHAFFETEMLENVSLPDSILLIGSSCFVGSQITEIRIPKYAEAGHTRMDTVESEPFDLDTTLIVAKDSPMHQYASENGYNFKTY